MTKCEKPLKIFKDERKYVQSIFEIRTFFVSGRCDNYYAAKNFDLLLFNESKSVEP